MSYKQVFIINNDLHMSKGKIAVQVAHGEVLYLENLLCNNDGCGSECSDDNDMKKLRSDTYEKWRSEEGGLMKKIVLKSDREEIMRIVCKLKESNIWSCEVFDMGLTQVPKNSFTCLVVEPLPEDVCDQMFGHLKLL